MQVPSIYPALLISFLMASSFKAQTVDWYKPSLLSLPSARCCGAMTHDPLMHASLLFGGGNGGIYPAVRYNDTWTFSSTSGWVQLSPANSPPARQGAGIAYDPTTETVVMFGGSGSTTALGDTWIWDGVNWTEQFPPVSPPAEVTAEEELVYDGATGTLVLWGSESGTTWEWNGRTKTWTQRFPTTSPPVSNATIAYDPAHRNVVLFGGTAAQGPLNQTWIWDGITWTQQFPAASPPPRGLPSLAYDPSIGAMVLFGGSAGPPSALNDTWIWNGVTWTQVQTTFTPLARWATAMDFDPRIGMVLFGGELQGDPFTNQTWLLVTSGLSQ